MINRADISPIKHKRHFRLLFVALIAILGIGVWLPGVKVRAAGAPKAPFNWTDNDHSQVVDANGNVYYPIGYACNASVTTNADATQIDPLSAPNGQTSATKLTETGNTNQQVTVGACANSHPAPYLWTTKTSPHLAFSVANSATSLFDTRFCPVRNNACIAGAFTLNNGISRPAVLDITSVTVDTSKAAIAAADAATAAAAAATAAAATGGGTAPGSDHPTCNTGGFGLNWILCPVFNTVAEFSDFLFSVLFEPLLRTAPISTDPTQPSYKVWSSFRIYGDIFLVIALLVIVFGQAIGGGLIDAYTAKKVLPRLLAAAILINLSIYIVALAVDFTNILGGGLGKLITTPIAGAGAFNISPSGVQGGVIVGLPVAVGIGAALLTLSGTLALGGAALTGAIPLLLLFVILPVVLGLLLSFVTLLLRKAILLALVFVSPIAFALYCLPNTEKYFHKWWSVFTKTLLVYPIVIVIFAVADVLSVTVSSNNNKNNPLASLISFILQFLPLFLIPYAFKLSGGFIGQIVGTLSGFSKRTHEGIKGDIRNPNSMRNRAKRRFGERFTAAEARIDAPGRSSTATRRQQRAMRVLNKIDRGWNARESKYTAEATAREDQISATGRDDQRYAANWFSVAAGEAAPVGVSRKGVDVSGSVDSSSERFFDSKGRAISEGYAKQSEALHATSAYDAGRNLEYPLRKAQTDDDLANYRRAFAATALRQGLNDDEIMGMHARASFEHKDKHATEWYSSPTLVKGEAGSADRIVWSDITDATKAGRRGQANHVKELHKSKASFQLSSVRDKELRSWSDRRNEIQDQLDAEEPLSHEDALFFTQTDELMGSLVQQGVITQMGDAGPQMSAQGVSSASASVLKAMSTNRRYETTAARSGTTANGQPLVSVNDRVIYNKEAVDDVVRQSIPTGGTTPTVFRSDVIDNLAVPIIQPLPRGTAGPVALGKSVAVTGDSQSSDIPRYF